MMRRRSLALLACCAAACCSGGAARRRAARVEHPPTPASPPAARAFPPPGLPHYRLVASINPAGRRLSAEARLQLRHDAKRPLQVFLHPALRLERVRVNDRPARFSVSTGQLPYVRRARAYRITGDLGAGPWLTLELTYSGQLPAEPAEVNRLGSTLVELAVYAAWYPIVPGMGPFSSELLVRLPPGFRLVSRGRRATAPQGGTRFRAAEPASDLVLLASRRFRRLERGDVQLWHTELPDEAAQRLLGLTRRVRQGFVRAFGPLPAGQPLALVFSPREGWGYSRPGLVVLAERPAAKAARAADEAAMRRTVHGIAHEVAHLWWSLADTSSRHDWINEALAEYSALRASSALFGPLEADRWRQRYLDHLEQQRPGRSIVDTGNDSPLRHVNWYERGALLFDALEHRVGRRALDRLLARLHRGRGEGPLTTGELRRRLGSVLGQPALKLAQRWLYMRAPTTRWLRRQRALSTARARRLDELRVVTDKLERVYSYLERKQKRHHFSYPELKARITDRVLRAASDADHVAALQALLGRFHDGHLKLVLPARGPRPPLPPAVTHRWLGGGVLLTRITRLHGDQRAIRRQLHRGLQLLRRARALIVDLRGNPGGNNQTSFDYVARLFAAPIQLGKSSVRRSKEVLTRRPRYEELYPADPDRPGFGRWRPAVLEPQTRESFDGPIAVLIDHGCFSSCESTALALKQSGKTRLYGQATGGGSANPITFDLPYTEGKLMVPTWIFVKASGELLEDNGVRPDVVLPPGTDALRRALADLRQQLKRRAR